MHVEYHPFPDPMREPIGVEVQGQYAVPVVAIPVRVVYAVETVLGRTGR